MTDSHHSIDSTESLPAITGCLFGTAVGDALGLPFEGLSAARIAKFTCRGLSHRLLFGRGMLSDDTEHSCMVAQALIKSAGEPHVFCRDLSWRMRFWLASLPAGIGLGTLRALLKLCMGFSGKYSGVSSAGNGPMMRSAILGVMVGDNPVLLKQLIHVNTRITHTDPRAERAAMVVAGAAWCNAPQIRVTPKTIKKQLDGWVHYDDELLDLIDKAGSSASLNETALQFCQQQGMGKGVSGYCYATLKVVLQIWLRHPYDYKQGISEAIHCGGDTDTVAAILGGVIGAGTGIDGIPAEWLEGLCDWPRTQSWLQLICRQLSATQAEWQARKPKPVFLPFALLRNGFFIPLVLLHGFRRLLPPY